MRCRFGCSICYAPSAAAFQMHIYTLDVFFEMCTLKLTFHVWLLLFVVGVGMAWCTVMK